MGLSLLAGCDNEKQQIFKEAEKDLEQGSYEYALDEFTTSVNNGVKPAVSYRGIGICQLRLGNYDDAITAFTSALGEEKVSKSMARDLYLYRATARLQAGYLDDAMADCQVLAQNYEMDADAWFLTGKVALEMDGYDEAASDFEQAYGEDSSYDRAIQIYETYLDKDMEADGTRYLEAVLSTEAKGAEDLCSRGRIYYYMGDYTNAQKELTDASNQGSTEALLVLGMVYGAQHNHFVVNSVSFADGMHYHDNKANLRLLRQRSDELCREYALSVIEHPSGKKKPYALYQAEKQGRPTRDNVARQAVDEAISKSFTLKDFDRQLAEMGYRINFDPNRKYWTIIGKGWQRPKRLYKLGEEYTNDRIMERISENSYAVKFQSFSEPQPQVKVSRVKGSLKNAKKMGGLRGLYLHYCYKLGILPKGRKQNYARLHYLLKDDLMKMEAITQETRLLCRNHIDTAEQLCSYKGSLETEMSALLQKRKELYSKSRRTSGEEKEAVKAELSDISGRLKIIRKEVRLCEGIAARSDTLKEKLQTIRADEHEQQRKELMKNEHRRRSGRTNRPNELGGL